MNLVNYDFAEIKIKGVGTATLKPPSADMSLKVFRLVSRLLSQREDLLPSDTVSNILKDNATITLSTNGLNNVLGTMLTLLQSEELDSVLKKCVNGYVTDSEGNVSLLNPNEFGKYFVSLESRESYYPIMYEIMLLAVTPFTKGLWQSLKALIDIFFKEKEAKKKKEQMEAEASVG